MPWSLASLRKSRLVYWQPRSEWNIAPAGGRRWLERHHQGVGDELGAHVVGQRPAHHPAAGQVDHGGQVRPAFPGGDVGDVAHVAGVEHVRRAEVALDQVKGLGLRRRVVDGGLAPAFLAPPLQAVQLASAAAPGAGRNPRPGRASSLCTRGEP